MEDAKKKKPTGQAAGKPGKPQKEVSAGLRKQPAIMNLGGNNAARKGKV
jgi:hypothetical protein